MEKTNIFKIKNDSEPNKVAGAIAEALKDYTKVHLHAIGAGAVNQAAKSIAIARGYVAPKGINLICIPAFRESEIDGESRTGIDFMVREEY